MAWFWPVGGRGDDGSKTRQSSGGFFEATGAHPRRPVASHDTGAHGVPELLVTSDVSDPVMTAASKQPPQVLCLGEALIDRLAPLATDRLPGMGGTARAGHDHLGGAPANVACALVRLGTSSAFVGRLGSDAFGARLAELFTARGVDQRGLQWDSRRPSRIVLVRRDPTGERQFGGFAGDGGAGFADQALDAGELSAALGPLLASARWLVLGTIPLASAAAAQAAWLAIREAAAAGVAIALDVNWRPTFWDAAADPAAGPTPLQRQQLEPLLAVPRLLKCTAEEAIWFFGSTDPAQVSAALPQRPLVVVTDGAAPLRWARAATAERLGLAGSLQPFAARVVDTTGAGDAFTAGLLHGLCGAPVEPPELPELMRFASACGALVCQGAGAMDPQPSAAQVRAFLAAAGAQGPAAGPGGQPRDCGGR